MIRLSWITLHRQFSRSELGKNFLRTRSIIIDCLLWKLNCAKTKHKTFRNCNNNLLLLFLHLALLENFTKWFLQSARHSRFSNIFVLNFRNWRFYNKNRCFAWCLYAVAYAENFHGGFHSGAYGGHLYLVCTVCDVTIWRHIYVSKPMFCWSLLT